MRTFFLICLVLFLASCASPEPEPIFSQGDVVILQCGTGCYAGEVALSETTGRSPNVGTLPVGTEVKILSWRIGEENSDMIFYRVRVGEIGSPDYLRGYVREDQLRLP